MWTLLLTERKNSGGWQQVGNYSALKEAAAEIIKRENIPVRGLFLETHIEADHGDDEECLSLFSYSGKEFLYSVEKRRQ